MNAVVLLADGRRGGELTQRPLPTADPSIDRLTARERARLAETWLVRAAMERRVADSFSVIAGALARRGASNDLVALAERAVDDEHRHTELSRVVASRFAGRELAMPKRLLLEVPAHAGATPELRDTLHIVGQCVLNETTASAFLETCLAHATGALAKSALRELLSDEVEHGRMGWTYLAGATLETRREVGRWILPMAFLNLRLWKNESPHDPDHRDVYTAHGAPPARILHEALTDALVTLIVPGLRALQVPTAALERWIDDGADTDTVPVS